MNAPLAPRPIQAMRIALGGQLLGLVQAVLLIQMAALPEALRFAIGLLWMLSAAALVATMLPTSAETPGSGHAR